MSGRALIDALVLGIDVACRIGNAMYPDHYDRGWHITGSTGMLGAAAGCARLLGLDAARTAMALGIAASQPVGLREQFGTMTKPFHPGGAARAGLTAALLAKHGFTARARALEAPRGLLQSVLDQVRLERDHRRAGRALRDLVQHLQAVRLRHRDPSEHRRLRAAAQRAGVRAEHIERIELARAFAGAGADRQEGAAHGLEGKFSVYHACAAGLMFGRAGEPEFSDACVDRSRRGRAARPRPGARRHVDRRGVGGRDGDAA